MRLRVALMMIAAAILLTSPVSVDAQTAPPADGTAARRDGPRSRRRPPPDKVVVLEGDTIVGRVPKPQVFYVLGRSEKRYRGLDVKRSFVRRIVESLKRNPL